MILSNNSEMQAFASPSYRQGVQDVEGLSNLHKDNEL